MFRSSVRLMLGRLPTTEEAADAVELLRGIWEKSNFLL
jgi:hypothetical protein